MRERYKHLRHEALMCRSTDMFLIKSKVDGKWPAKEQAKCLGNWVRGEERIPTGLGWGDEDLRRPPRRNLTWPGLLRMRKKNGISRVSGLRRVPAGGTGLCLCCGLNCIPPPPNSYVEVRSLVPQNVIT